MSVNLIIIIIMCNLQFSVHSTTVIAMSLLLHFILYTCFFTHPLAHHHPQNQTHHCTTKCGTFHIPFPFYLNSSACPTLSHAFSLSCINSSSLFLNLASQNYRVIDFFSDGVLLDLDFANNTTIMCRHYNALKSLDLSKNEYFGISIDNVVDLYDCEDSSLCKTDCGSVPPACDGQTAGYPCCCYPLSDHSSWRPGDSLTDFSQYGCRGFSSWVVLPGTGIAKRGIKLEWAVPGNSTEATCAANADVVNATSVASGIRCQCRDGFVGDGFSIGVGCVKSCFKDGKEVHGDDCYRNKHGRKKAIILAGVMTSALAIVSLMGFCLLKRTIKSETYVSSQAHCQSTIFSQKASRPRLFAYHELEKATKEFEDGQKIVDSCTTTLYAGVLTGGSHVAVQRVQCESERDVIQVLFRLETLSAISHRNMACIIGWSIDSGYTPLVVYDYPTNGTFKQHLSRARHENVPLEWYKRLNIAAETASVLVFLQHEISPPIFHHDLQSGCIFLDIDFSVKLGGFELHDAGYGGSCHSSEGSHHCRRNDVYSFGLVLLEIITGNTMVNYSTTALQKIKKGKVEEIVDPSLYYHEQPAFRREQIEIIADLATRCLLFGSDGRLGMVDVARELVHIAKDRPDGSSSGRGPGLEETFSNSSLLQMISMSPDSRENLFPALHATQQLILRELEP